MSNPNQNNLLPKVQLKTKKRKQGKNMTEKNNNNQSSKIDDSISKISEINSKNNIIKQGPKIIDEVTKGSQRIDIIKHKIYKIIFVFRNEDFYITVKLTTLIKNMKKSICQLIGLDTDKINLMYQNSVIDDSYGGKTVGEYFDLKNIKFRPIVYIIKKFRAKVDPSLFSMLIKTYDYKVKVQNYPIELDKNSESNNSIDNIINSFFKSCYSVNNNNNTLENIYHYKIEPISPDLDTEEEKKDIKKENLTFFVCFSSQDIAFDFNRYMNALKLINNSFKDVKTQVIQNKKKIIKIRNDNQENTSMMIRYGIDYGLDDDTNLIKKYSKILR